MTETTHADAIGYARGILNRAGTLESARALAEIVGRYDRLLAEDEPGMFSWHQALYDVAQQSARAAEAIAATLGEDGDAVTDEAVRRALAARNLSGLSQTGKCFLALAAIGGEGSTADVNRWLKLHGEQIPGVLSKLHWLTRRKRPPVELVERGERSVSPSCWRLTAYGRAVTGAGERSTLEEGAP